MKEQPDEIKDIENGLNKLLQTSVDEEDCYNCEGDMLGENMFECLLPPKKKDFPDIFETNKSS